VSARHGLHHHEHPQETAPRGGAVILDIGGDVGALLVRLDDERHGTELHIRPVGRPDATSHTGVWRRNVEGRPVVAVFGALAAGDYELLDDQGNARCLATVEPATVTELDLRPSSPTERGRPSPR